MAGFIRTERIQKIPSCPSVSSFRSAMNACTLANRHAKIRYAFKKKFGTQCNLWLSWWSRRNGASAMLHHISAVQRSGVHHGCNALHESSPPCAVDCRRSSAACSRCTAAAGRYIQGSKSQRRVNNQGHRKRMEQSGRKLRYPRSTC